MIGVPFRVRACAAIVLAAFAAGANAVDWPQEVTAPDGNKVVVYQPQPESLKGNVLTGRAAMSLELKNKPEPIFGAFWFTARVDTDQDAGIATVRDMHITKVGWPDSSDEQEQRFTSIVEAALPKAGYEISLERLSASLQSADREKKSLQDLKNTPPKIIFSSQLAVLLLYDGAPKFSPVEKSDYERALNTPFAVVRSKKTQQCYLSSGKLWYTAKDPLGPWTVLATPPADLVKLIPNTASDEPPPKTPPKIVVATEPTELVSTDGAPQWKALPDGNLLYAVNTETPWLRELSSQQMYVLLSGRWFKAASDKGPWTFVRPDQLPESFKKIPPGSDIGGTRVSVAGTEEAEDAMLDQQIPQTAAIKRSEAKLDVKYDGAPKFEKIPGTSVAYAVNTAAQVLQIGNAYYAVDNGVWFTATSATGPWHVADKIPEDQIQQIPPSSPVYNTTYVHIYESTPEVVYVGYTPGYMWSFPYYGVPVYGTGWYYPPYWGAVYYPRPPTWGFHVGYNPWTGWNFGVSWSNGFFSVGASWGGGWGGSFHPGYCCGGWYGGGYRRPPVIVNTGNINIGNSISVGNRTNINNRIDRNRINDNRVGNNNIYNRPENRVRVADRTTATSNLQQARAVSGRDNDVFADKSGNVARRNGDTWETRDHGNWAPEKVAANAPHARDQVPDQSAARAQQQPHQTQQTRDRPQEAAPEAYSRINQSDLDHAHDARQSGARREGSRPARRGGRR